MRCVIFHEVIGFFTRHTVDVTHLVAEFDSVELVGVFQEFRSEGSRDELSCFGQFVDHIGYSLTMLRIQRLGKEKFNMTLFRWEEVRRHNWHLAKPTVKHRPPFAQSHSTAE